MRLALSTAWNSLRCKSGQEIIEEIKGLGFSEFELSFNLSEEVVRNFQSAVDKKQIVVNALHNYCPIPEDMPREKALPDCFSIGSSDSQERASAVKYTKITIDTARRLNAKAVVLHCGRVEIKDYTRDLISLFVGGKISSPEAVALIGKMRAEREEKLDCYLPKVFQSLDEISDYACRQGLRIGVENRFYFREIPSFEEIGKILEIFKDRNIFYWHDTGHAQLWEDLGFVEHRRYLEAYSTSLLGIHIHDIKGGRDHMAPLRGNIDFELFKPYLKRDTLKTLEVHEPATAGEIASAKVFLEKLYGTD